MASVDDLKNGLIEKILSIQNKALLEALDEIVSTNDTNTSEKITLTKAQKAMLEMSEQDIKEGRLISQEAMDKRNLEWLNAL
jgi:hypothetical protein